MVRSSLATPLALLAACQPPPETPGERHNRELAEQREYETTQFRACVEKYAKADGARDADQDAALGRAQVIFMTINGVSVETVAPALGYCAPAIDLQLYARDQPFRQMSWCCHHDLDVPLRGECREAEERNVAAYNSRLAVVAPDFVTSFCGPELVPPPSSSRVVGYRPAADL